MISRKRLRLHIVLLLLGVRLHDRKCTMPRVPEPDGGSMRKRQFLGSLLGAGGGLLVDGRVREAVTAPPASRLKITRVRLYEAPSPRPTFNQSNAVVTVQTDQGLTGIGEGGARDMVDPP